MKKIALACIIKDDSEVDDFKRMLDSCAKWVDAIYITGTKDPQKKIKEVCKEYGAIWSWFPWIKDFSAARNFNFSQVPKEYDFIFWMDVDDILVGGENLKKVLADESVDKYNIGAIFARYLYQVEVDAKGNISNILIEHLRERLIRNNGNYKWVAPIHETLIPQVPAGQSDTKDFYVVHLSNMEDMMNSMWRNIDILEEEVMNNSADPRPIYYLAKAYFDTKLPELLYEPLGPDTESLAIELLKDYVRKSGWAEERSQALEYTALLYREMGENKKAIKCLLQAVEEGPTFPSVYIQLALTYVILNDWNKAYHWVKVASNMEIPKTTLVIQPKDYKMLILEALFHIYRNTNKLDECLNVTQGLYQLLPNDLNKLRLEEITDWKGKNDLAHWVAKLANHLHKTDQTMQLQALINAIPKEIADTQVMASLRNDFLPPHNWKEDEIAIFCGPGFEKWSPLSVAKGIGGSEEAVINMGKELAKLGWKVTVFADPQDDAGEYDGVKYVQHHEINWHDNFNILIAWRNIGVFDLPLSTKKAYLWNHDIQTPMTYTKERVAKIDKVMFLSKWHRQNVPQLDESKVMYTANGL